MAKPANGTGLDSGNGLYSGLIGAFAFYEGSGTALGDQKTGNASEGALSGASLPTWATTVDDSGVLFGGGGYQNSYIACGSVAALQDLWNGTPGSVFIRLRTGVATISRALIGRNDNNAADIGWLIGIDSAGQFMLLSEFSSTNMRARITAGAAANTFYNMLITHDGSLTSANAIFYLDGVAVGTTNTDGVGTKSTDAGEVLQIGTQNGGYGQMAANSFDGHIYEILIWNRILSSGEAASLYADPYQVYAAAGGGSTPEPPVRMPTIADRVARSVALASAIVVHTYVGQHVLRGAAKRTKVALPVVVDVKITPPKTLTEFLPYPRKGAAIRKPRPFPDVVLIRKPLPVTRSIALPHMLKGAPQRKPWPFPEVTAVRTPPPRTDLVTLPHFFQPPAAPYRVIVDPTVTAVRMLAPKTQAVVGKAVAQGEERGPFARLVSALVRTRFPTVRSDVLASAIAHPVTGSGAPIVSMIEMDPPIARAFVGRRRLVPPPPPASPRPRPAVSFFRAPRPVTESTVGSPLSRNPVSAKSFARPVLALARSLRPVAETFLAAARRVAAPVISRARPLVTRVRIPFPRMESYAGSGVERGPLQALTRAIAQNDSTIKIGPDSEVITLGPSDNGTISLNPTDSPDD